mmetsp:Transcript_28746/g.66766  ORF Transcript_28746/g.66766 Transcript_28746/m.66766 type:complete len:406 (-) Transcript_28746:124-1341(-)|eukprot:CAMPEP_0178439144 /NCGR_PEP_ID=MMETSP0689_2-20121128/35993_1 /TAXON_ID=160604 /ORGANISM="Amphidinium massartii, Strain CS-259" /LENGTH=405 /DNA_ID=CAMNT_0020061641 /DNA_START=108 /DNA_END=1325 /DNA_ORIENTATION=+
MTADDEEGDLSDFRAFVNMTKGLIGLGILTLPWATAKVGIIPTAISMPVIAYLMLWGILLAAKGKDRVDGLEKSEVQPIQQIESAEGAEESWSSNLGYFDRVVGTVFGSPARFLTVGCLLMVQFSTGVVYISNVTKSITDSVPVRREFVILSICITYMLLSLTNRLRRVAYLSLFALLTYFLIFISMVKECILHRQQTDVSLELFKSSGADFGALYAAVAFALGAFPLSNVIHDEMQHKAHFTSVMSSSFAVTTLIYLIFALVGYVGWGDAANEIIYLNFPQGSATRVGCIVSMTLILSFSFVLQMTPVFLFMQARMPELHFGVVNSLVVVAAALSSYLLPSVMLVIGTFSTVSGQIVGMIMPALVFLWLSSSYEMWHRFLSVVVLGLGVVGGVLAVRSSVAGPA